LPYENLYLKSGAKKQAIKPDVSYFLVVSAFIFEVSADIFEVSADIFVVSGVTAGAVAALIESAIRAESSGVVVGVSAELLQAAKAAAIANTKNTFFICCNFLSLIYTH